MFFRSSKTSAQRPAPSALTLVEMLISMAVTLLMMAAVVNLFANIGAGVSNRRASMELGSQLRMARARLFKDLAGATCPARPKLPSDDHDDGYIELIEGQFSDKFPSVLVDGNTVNGEIDIATSIIPGSNVGPIDATDGLGLGDYDDVLALTVRSESEPFVGRLAVWNGTEWIVTTIESDLAEIIWFAVENPADGSNGEPGMRTVYRRVLLIAPWVSELPPERLSSQPLKAILSNRVYHQLSDISYRRVVLDPSNPATSDIIRVPNTLADLTKRENRFAHFGAPDQFPHELDIRAIRNNPSTNRNNFPEFIPGGGFGPALIPFGLPFEWDEDGSFTLADNDNNIPTIPPGTNNPGDDRQGEDVMLNDVLAFDLRVFDPGAQIVSVAGITTEPSDAGWRYEPSVKFPVVGFGAYVDINYWNQYEVYINNIVGLADSGLTNLPAAIHPDPTVFSGVASPKSLLATPQFTVYDTWPYHYETDGIDQDGDGVDLDNADGDNDNTTGIDVGLDEGTDGLDNDGNNGVDDTLERETAPPYDTPLRGMQVKIRVYDRDSRQIREATVTKNFVPQ